MKSISIKMPWANLVAFGGFKTVECRTWRTNYRGDLLICASQSTSLCHSGNEKALCGKALAVVELVDVRKMTKDDLDSAFIPDTAHKEALNGYAWHLRHKYQIEPFEVKGKLNLFETDDALIKTLDLSKHINYFEFLGLEDDYSLEKRIYSLLDKPTSEKISLIIQYLEEIQLITFDDDKGLFDTKKLDLMNDKEILETLEKGGV